MCWLYVGYRWHDKPTIASCWLHYLSWGWLRGRTTGRAICRLASQESPRLQHEKTGSTRRAGCASSRLATPPRRTGAGRWRQSFPTVVWPKVGWPRQERQGRRTGVTSATTTSSQWEIEDPSPRQDPRQKRRDMWYVSNVSIIFYAPCLFLHHLPIVSLHLVAFLCIFRN
jgi:hypothetical protein